MNLGLLSDAHGNHVALRHAVSWLTSRVDHFVFAGDAFSDHRFSNEVVDTLRTLGATYVLGNHELSLLGAAGARARGAGHVRHELVEYVATRPTQVCAVFGGVRVMVVHASPWPPYDQYLTPDHPALRRCAELATDVLVLGHAHVPFSVRAGDTLVVNPGSVGRVDGTDELSFAILDTSDLSVAHYRFTGNEAEITPLVQR